MITLSQLWMPIVGSSIVVFIVSSLIHMVFKWHDVEFRPLANEDDVRSVLQRTSPEPGQYAVPHCADAKAMHRADVQQKFVDGPVALIVLRARGLPNMGMALGLWFLYTLVLGVCAGYLASRTLPAGTAFASVFRLVATMLLLAYGAGSVQAGIWMGKPWSSAAKDLLDALIYAVITGAVFGWLYPH